MLRSLAQHAEDAGVGRNHIPASCTGAMCCERTPFACQPPLQPATPYTVCPRASSAKACCCCCASPLGRYPVWTPTRPLLLELYRTVHRAVGLSAAESCAVGAACGSRPHTTLCLSGGLAVDEGSELRKVHVQMHSTTATPPRSQG